MDYLDKQKQIAREKERKAEEAKKIKEEKKQKAEEKRREKLERSSDRSTASADGKLLISKIKKLKRLYKNGTLDKAEFEKAKNRLLK